MREWAAEFGISRPHLIALMDGSREPSINVASRIQERTGGEVPITVWPNIAAMMKTLGGDAA